MNNFYKGGRVHAYLKGILQSIYTIKNKCSKRQIVPEYAVAKNALKNNIAQTTNVDLSLRVCYGEGSVILRESIVPDSGLDCHSFGYLLLNNHIISNEIAIKQQRISKQGATQTLCRSLEEAKKEPRNGNESVMKHHANGRETAINKQTKTRENRSRIKNSAPFRILFGLASRFLRVGFVPESGQARDSFGSSSTAVRQLVEGQSKRTRTAVEAVPKQSRSSLEDVSKRTRRSVEEVPTPNQVRTVFYPEAQFYRSSIASAPYLHQEKSGATTAQLLSGCSKTYKKVRSWLKESIRKIKTSALKAFNSVSRADDQFCYDYLANRLKCISNEKMCGVLDVVNEGARDLSLKSRFSVPLILLLLMTFGSVSAQAQNKQNYVLQGKVVSAVDGKPLQGVSVHVEAEKLKTSTKKDGSFNIAVSQRSGKVKLTYVGYKTQELEYASGVVLFVQLNIIDNQLDEVEVVSTGFQKIPKERATGSFEFVDNKLFNRKVSTDFVSRLEDVVPSISTNKTYAPSRGKLLGINIRGTSTMDWNVWPLVVIDGVPYQNNFDPLNGSFNNINPNDIENITVLKDAAASSIWGAQSGNGVIVITTKRGKYNQPFQLSVNSNVTIAQKPDLYYYPQMNTSDYIDLEKELFDKGYWNSRINRYDVNLTPVIQLLKKHKEGDLSQMDLNQQLDALRGIDMREDFLKYIYRESANQQYNVRLSGGSEKMNTSFSIGYDKNLDDLVTSSYNRMTIKNNTQIRPIKNLTLDLGITYTESKRKDAMANMVGYNSMGRGAGNFPYMKMADQYGNPLVVDAIGYNPIFRDTVAGGRLLDWKYRPLEELNDTHLITKIRETFLNFKASYQIFPSISASVLYAYQRAYQPTDEWQGLGSVHLRETINYRASWDKDKVIWNLPVGDYLNTSHRNNDTYQIRNQVDFHKKWNEMHEISAIGGAEIRQIRSTMQNSVYWGYDPELLTHQPVQNGKRIPALNGISGSLYLRDFANMDASTNRYTSYFANANYTYNDRYILSGSVRKDASNLFGVKSNGRGQPFWSIGGSWLLSKEAFINDQLFPLLKLRATYGYNGNVNNSTAAYPIISIQTSPDYITGQPYASMQSPPNPSLRWERVGMLNLGLDFSFKNRISGSLEYYIKRPKDLIAGAKIDPTTGYSSLNVNSANLDGRGVDISLNSVNIKSNHFNWTSNLVFAYNRTKVIKSYLSSTRGKDYITGPYGMGMTPIEGMQLYSLLTYKWAGLNPETGMPRGFVHGEVSEDYSTIVNRGTIEDLENHGSLQPVYFGSFRNNFSYKNLELSFNISYQLGHKFLRNSFNNRWFIDNGRGHSDYALRWQKPGDEKQTDVPAFIYPNNLYASELYYYSSALVEPADQIKLRDIQLSYNLNSLNRAGFKNVRLYAYIQNPGTIWRANKLGLDPEFGDAIPDPMSVSLGLNFNL